MSVERAVVVEDVDRLEAVFLTEHVVVHVVRRGHLQRTGTELDIDVLVADHRHGTVHQRHDHTGVRGQVPVARVVRVHAQRRVPEDRLGPRRGHDQVVRRPIDHIAQVVELALRLAVDHLFVREGRQRSGVPVDHPHAAVNLPFVIEVYENLDDAPAQRRIHRELRPLPVARRAEAAQLAQDDAAVLLLPLPRMLQKLLARERTLVDPLGFELGHDFRLGGDRRVVGARHPAGVLTLHPRAAHQHVLDRLVEHVAHVQHACHVGGRNYDRIGLPRVGNRVEEAVLHPVVVPLLFDLLRSVFRCDFHSRLSFCYVLIFFLCHVPAGGAVPPRYFPPNAAAAQDLHPICKDSVLQ